jgi:very-short-patch-repair endonuclease
MTSSEIKLWKYIKDKDIWVRFMRQKPIYVYTESSWLDKFIIADFYCREKKLIIEVDGSIHNLKEVLEIDKHKEELLKNLWIKVIRIKNSEIENNINIVINEIRNKL